MKLTALLLLMSINLFGQGLKSPDNPLEGRLVFEEKGCIECHSLSGYGGEVGPDLMKRQYFGSFSDMAAIIWNHIPQMNRMFRKLHRERPYINNKEMNSLVSFLYYLHYLGQPGSLSKGKALLNKKGCLNCHSVNGKGGDAAPDFAGIEFNASPVFMVQTMWNHFPGMSQEFSVAGKNLITLTGKDVVNIASYIQAVSPKTVNTRMTPGNPNKGEKIFKQKGCIKCHSVDGEKTKKLGPSLKKLKLHSSVAEIGATMWNHAESMRHLMGKKKMDWPLFKGAEMADLISYLYFLDFQDEPGDAFKGKSAFEEKRCANCHSSDDGVGPNLSKGLKLKSPVQMITKMWNHSAGMEDQILTYNEYWPKLSSEDIRNIYTFLTNSYKKEK